MGLKPETGGEAEDGTGILRNIGLEQRNPHLILQVHRRGETPAPLPVLPATPESNGAHLSPPVTSSGPAALAALHSDGKSANKPARWCNAAYTTSRYPPTAFSGGRVG
jgi:hypothetical protein